MAEERVQRRLAAILAADVVGYSRLMEQDEAATLAAFKAHLEELILPAIAEHRGRVVKTTGDGFLVEFASVVDAARCAVSVQHGMVERNLAVAADRRQQFRIGINLGDVVIEGDDIHGDGVNVAARLEQNAPAGGILISGGAYDQLQGKLDLSLELVGEQQVKNIARPIRIYRVRLDSGPAPMSALTTRHSRLARMAGALAILLLLGVGLWVAYERWETASPPASIVPPLTERPSLAVLPFANIGGDEATGRLADGLTEDIINDLSRYRDMDVIAHTSTEQYEGKSVDLRQIGRDLNARYVLEGSVQREGDQIRITAQLIDARSGTHLWSERWDRPAKEFFSVQTEIANQVGDRLGGGGWIVVAAEQGSARRARPEDLTAYELYLAGRSEAMRADAEGNEKAMNLFQRAVEASPLFARAWVELGSAQIHSVDYGADWAVAIPAALATLKRAIALDPEDALAHAVLARTLGLQGDLAQSEAEFEKALRLNPGSAEVLALYSSFASTFGHPERGAEAADRAIRLNPNYPVWQAWNFSYAYFVNGRYEEALRVLERLPKENYLFYSWVIRAASYAALGRTTEAKAALDDALSHHPDLTIEGFIGTPDWSEAERKRLSETMRKAGFPVCVKPETLARFPQLVRLPECLAK